MFGFFKSFRNSWPPNPMNRPWVHVAVGWIQKSSAPTWVYSCYEASHNNHRRHPAGSAEGHESTPYEDQHSGSHQCPFPVYRDTDPFMIKPSNRLFYTPMIDHTDLPYLVTSLPTSSAPIIPPMAKMDTVREYRTVRSSSSAAKS